MKKGQKSRRGGIQDLLCPFTYVRITQGNGVGTHRGTLAFDIASKNKTEEAYYAPCDVKCVMIYPSSGQAMWQSLEKVRMPSGLIDYVTMVTVHDNSFNSYVGQVISQGIQLGNKGTKGNATGIHAHIEIARGQKTSRNWYKNSYGIYTMNDEIMMEDAFFMDNTEIDPTSIARNWRYLTSVSEGAADQILYPGSKVKFQGVFLVNRAFYPNKTYPNGAVISYQTCYRGAFGSAGYIPCGPLIKCDQNGNNGDAHGTLYTGNYFKCDTIFTVIRASAPTSQCPNGIATIKADGISFKVDCGVLYEISDS